MKSFKKILYLTAIVYFAFNAVVSFLYYQEASSDNDSKIVEQLRDLKPLNGFQILAEMAGYVDYSPPTQFTRYFPPLFGLLAIYLVIRPRARANKLQRKNLSSQRDEEVRKEQQDRQRVRGHEKAEQLFATNNPSSAQIPAHSGDRGGLVAGAEGLVEWFFGEYLVAHHDRFKDLGGLNLPYNIGANPVLQGREALIKSSEMASVATGDETKKSVTNAANLFEDAFVAVDPHEFRGDLIVGRANARMWLGICKSILGNDATSLDEPQLDGAGLAFAEATAKFLAINDFVLVGRVTQEWAESLLYAGLKDDANTMFMISMLIFNSFDEKARAQVVLNRSQNTESSRIDSSFLARGTTVNSESMTTILGCRNTSLLRDICISA